MHVSRMLTFVHALVAQLHRPYLDAVLRKKIPLQDLVADRTFYGVHKPLKTHKISAHFDNRYSHM
jgi:hypothetical protein